MRHEPPLLLLLLASGHHPVRQTDTEEKVRSAQVPVVRLIQPLLLLAPHRRRLISV
jgi:hypothetical protein